MAKKIKAKEPQKELSDIEKLRARYRVPVNQAEVAEFLKDISPQLAYEYVIFGGPPVPVDPEEAFQLFVDYYATLQKLVEISLFVDRYPSKSQDGIRAELQEIEEFIKAAEKISPNDATYQRGTGIILTENREGHEYIRLKTGFYTEVKPGGKTRMTRREHMEGSLSATVYGRYFLFREWLDEQLEKPAENLLNDTEKKIILLRKENIPYGDIAQRLNIAEDTVKSNLRRAAKKIGANSVKGLHRFLDRE